MPEVKTTIKLKMKLRLLIAVISIGIINTAVFAQKKSKPNILFIAIDDLKPELGCYGNNIVKTPNIDRLAAMGTVFLNNYCQQAVCGPTRASLMTGMRPDATKVLDLKTKMRDVVPDILTLPQYLITQGYTTAGVGKIYHPSCVDKKNDEPSWSIPFMKPAASDYANGLGEPAKKHYQSPETKAAINAEAPASDKDKKADDGESTSGAVKPSSECLDLPDNAYEDGVSALIAKKAIIELSKDKKPFFFACGFHKPHLPFVSPKKYWDLYKREDMPIAEFQEHAKNEVFIAYESWRPPSDVIQEVFRSSRLLQERLLLSAKKDALTFIATKSDIFGEDDRKFEILGLNPTLNQKAILMVEEREKSLLSALNDFAESVSEAAVDDRSADEIESAIKASKYFFTSSTEYTRIIRTDVEQKLTSNSKFVTQEQTGIPALTAHINRITLEVGPKVLYRRIWNELLSAESSFRIVYNNQFVRFMGLNELNTERIFQLTQYKLSLFLNISLPINTSISSNIKDSKILIPHIITNGLGLPNKDYYFLETKTYQSRQIKVFVCDKIFGRASNLSPKKNEKMGP
jgi:hypothetical protein